MTETLTAAPVRTPTVYFIDDSATMREVIKIAFRKENIHVVTCADAASALAQFGEVAPDAVITDVIMPDKDGYEVCQFIKQHERFAATPVILMSGVVNKSVAEKAMAVKADELIRKPFQPQDLITRVKNLLSPKSAEVSKVEAAPVSAVDGPRFSSQVLTSLFSAGAPSVASPSASSAVSSRPLVAPAIAGTPRANTPSPSSAVPPRPAAPSISAAELQKLKNEVVRLELLVKKLQAELEAEHQYCAALESHFKSLQQS